MISVASAGLEQMSFEIVEPLAEGATAAAPRTKAEIAKLPELAAKYGIEIRVPWH